MPRNWQWTYAPLSCFAPGCAFYGIRAVPFDGIRAVSFALAFWHLCCALFFFGIAGLSYRIISSSSWRMTVSFRKSIIHPYTQIDRLIGCKLFKDINIVRLCTVVCKEIQIRAQVWLSWRSVFIFYFLPTWRRQYAIFSIYKLPLTHFPVFFEIVGSLETVYRCTPVLTRSSSDTFLRVDGRMYVLLPLQAATPVNLDRIDRPYFWTQHTVPKPAYRP